MGSFVLHANEPDLMHLLSLLQVPHGTVVPHEAPDDLHIIRWGVYAPDPLLALNQRLLNPLKCVLRASHLKTTHEILQLHGMKVAPMSTSEPISYSYEYIIPVFHLAAHSVFEKKRMSPIFSDYPYSNQAAERFREMNLNEPGFHLRRALRVALQAVYALGLDVAVVYISINARGETLVINVDAVPKLTKRLAAIFAQSIHGYDQEQLVLAEEKSAKPIQLATLGADPEFILLRPDGRVVSAARYMERQGSVGCDAVVLHNHRVILPLVELRPDPSPDPRLLLKNLRKMMVQADLMINDRQLRWLTGGMPIKGIPLGGHIHFSGVELSSQLLRVLDNYLALPLVLLEGPAASKRRPRYGVLGDFRKQSHGGFEYRTLASWLGTPQIAGGVLSLASVIANHFTLLKQQPLLHLDVQRAYYKGEKAKLLPFVYELWKDVQSTPTYSNYCDELDELFQLLVNLKAWPDGEDFRKHWQLPNSKQTVDTIRRFVL